MLLANDVMRAISEETARRIKVYPVNNLRASNIGHPCERYLYLLLTHWDEQEAHDVGLQNIFDLGNKIEEYTIGKIRAAGFETITPTQRSWRVDLLNGVVTGREDLRIKDPDDGQLIPVEVKGLSPYEWERLHSIDDFYKSKKHYVRAYPSQLLVYCYKFEKEYGLFALTNKLTGEIKLIDVPFDWDRADALLKKGERVYSARNGDISVSDLRPCDDYTVCETCQMRHLCTASVKRAETEIDDGELEALIDKKESLAPAYREYVDTKDQIKACMGDREKVLAGNYLIEAKTIFRKSYTVPERTEQRITISRI